MLEGSGFGHFPPIPANLDDPMAEQMNRDVRNYLLQETDWTQLSDVNQKTRYAYVSYRQQLRDITEHENWPNLNETDWPKKPNV